MKEEWEKEIERQENFILKLRSDFHTIAWGEQADVISHIPKGWEKIVYDLFHCIDNYYRRDHKKFEDTVICKYKFAHNRIVDKIKNKITKHLDPYKGLIDNENKMRFITQNMEKIARETKTWKIRNVLHIIFNKFKFNLSKHWVADPPQILEVQQLKSKYASLRFYKSGGDAYVDGMIMLAEHLASKTCELTGDPGEACNKGGWWTILSEEKQEEMGVKPPKKDSPGISIYAG